jgi:AcrR family transcriptional regulator
MPAPSRTKRPRRGRRATYHHGDLPRALRDAASRLLAERGSDGLTLREAARLVGVNHAAAYRHFTDKRALLAAVAEDGYAKLAREMHEADVGTARADPGERLRRVGTAYVAFARADPALFALMTGPRLNEDGRFPSLERALRDGVAALEAPLRDGQASRLFRDGPIEPIALGVLMLVHGYAQMVLTRRVRVAPVRIGEHLGTLLEPFLRGLRR